MCVCCVCVCCVSVCVSVCTDMYNVCGFFWVNFFFSLLCVATSLSYSIATPVSVIRFEVLAKKFFGGHTPLGVTEMAVKDIPAGATNGQEMVRCMGD